MGKNKIFRLPRFLILLFIFGLLIFASAGYILADSFLLSDYPGMCIDGSVTSQGSDYYVTLRYCNSGETPPANYTLNTSTGVIHVTLPTSANCTYSYTCGQCVSGGTMQCTVASVYPPNVTCSNTPLLTQACTYTPPAAPCTSYTYSDWSGCKSNGTQTRTITGSIPTGCLITTNGSATPEPLSQPCTVCAYPCGDWTFCSNTGIRTRACSPTPSGCVPPEDTTQIPLTQDSCTSLTDCVYTYSCGACLSSGTQSCTVTSVSPASVNCSNVPIPIQSCSYASPMTTTPVTCTHTCVRWNDCSSMNNQTCAQILSTPTGANCLNPVTSAITASFSRSCTSCNYKCNKWDICNSNGSQMCLEYTHTPVGTVCPETPATALTQPCVYISTTKIPCVYTYGLWSECDSAGMRTRSYTATPTGCYQVAAPFTKESCILPPSVPCDTFSYSSWSNCKSDGTQTRTITAKSPNACVDTSAALLKQKCDFVSSCTSYAYSDWSLCQSSGTQTRTITSKNPDGCTDTASAILKQNCSNLPCNAYAYGSWSDCDNAGKQTRKVVNSSPNGCSGGVAPILEQECNLNKKNSCKYEYSDWGSCDLGGSQARKLLSITPENCSRDEAPVLEQACEYLPPLIPQGGVSQPKPPCVYSYSAWGACVSKKQKRMVVALTPAECDASVAPVLTQVCDDSFSILPVMASDAPVPAPSSMLQSAAQNESTLNDRTSADWQKYYFGSANCIDEKVCAGMADPDNDGLSNNDEYRFGTNPKSPDTDRDGRVDGDEIKMGRNPLIASSEKVFDAMIYEDPKNNGQELKEIYQVSGVDYDVNKKELKISGKALPNSYVSIYVYSDPIVLTVKTDTDGNWVYVLDKPMEEGNHEVYVVVNDNSGRVAAKSAALPFVQTAEAATVYHPRVNNEEKAPTPVKARLWEGYLIFFGSAIGGLLLVLLVIGLTRKIGNPKSGNG